MWLTPFLYFFSSYGIWFKYFAFWLQVKNTFFERLCRNKTMLTVNGGFPGPTIHVRKGNRAYVMSTMKQAMVSLFTGDGSLSLSFSLSLSLSTLYRPSNQFGERKKKKKLYFKQCIWTFFFFFEKRTIFFYQKFIWWKLIKQ